MEHRYTWRLFEEIHHRGLVSVRLWLAIYKDKIISGMLCFYSKKIVVYWHGATLKDYFIYRPVNLLFYEVIRNSCQNGYGWFDFLPSGSLKGVITFKESFGPEALSCPKIYIENRIIKYYEKTTTFLGKKAGTVGRK